MKKIVFNDGSISSSNSIDIYYQTAKFHTFSTKMHNFMLSSLTNSLLETVGSRSVSQRGLRDTNAPGARLRSADSVIGYI